MQEEDIWAWEPEKHGTYTVKSAYKLLDSRHYHQEVMHDSGPSGDTTWKLIWKLDVPPKVKSVLVESPTYEFLPARQILHRRHIKENAHCEVCGVPAESIGHVLMECTVAMIFWEQAKKITGVKLSRFHPGTWARDIILLLDSPRERAILVICGLCGCRGISASMGKRCYR